MDQPTSNTVPPSVVSEPIPDMGVPKPPPKTLPKLPSLPIKKILIALVALICIGGVGLLAKTVLGRRGSLSPASESRPITLVYWGMWEDNDNLKAVIKDFEAQNPGVTVQYSSQSPKDYSDRLISACTRGQCPDLFRFHSTWATQYNQKGLLATLPASVMSNSEYEQTFYPVVSTDLKTPTGYVGIPLMFDGLGLYINKRILQASGKSVPTTWDELRTLAGELTIKGTNGTSIERSGVALGTANNVDHFSDILTVLILQNSGSPAKPEAFGSGSSTSGGANGQASLVGDALTFYTQFARTDKIWDETLPNSTYAFAIEKAAMILAPAWRAAEIKKINPNFEFEVYPIPQLPGKPVTYANYWVEGVSKTSKEQDSAWKLLKYLSQKDTLLKLNAPQAGQPIKEVYPRQDMAGLLANDPYAGAIVRQAPTARSFYMSSRTFDKGINDKMIEAYADIVTQMAKGARYDELAVKFAPSIQNLVTSFGIRP
ncbi:MAG: extracellular solute-binding protein [Candidatus Woesebacteria bacterium]